MKIIKPLKKSAISAQNKGVNFVIWACEIEWHDWMDDFVSGDEPTERELKNINNFLLNIWEEVKK